MSSLPCAVASCQANQAAQPEQAQPAGIKCIPLSSVVVGRRPAGGCILGEEVVGCRGQSEKRGKGNALEQMSHVRFLALKLTRRLFFRQVWQASKLHAATLESSAPGNAGVSSGDERAQM